MKCRNYLLTLFISCLLMAGWSFPDQSPYVIVDCQLGNNYPIHFAENMVQYLHVSDTSILSSYSGSVYGYGLGDMRITWQTYNTPYYSSGYQSVDLRITQVKENHLYDYSTEKRINVNYSYIVISCMVMMIILLFVKR